MKRLIVFVGLIFVSACGSSAAPVAPTPVVPACQANNTATVALQNVSRTNATYDFLVDNIQYATVSPNQTSVAVTVSAGAQHSVITRFTNTTVTACGSTSSFAQCATQVLTCGT